MDETPKVPLIPTAARQAELKKAANNILIKAGFGKTGRVKKKPKAKRRKR
jgi:hypothetical protein